MTKITIIEDLSSELWLDIFAYLNIRDQFNGFFNLNQRLQQLLLNYHYYISLKNNDENSRYLLEYILPQLPHPEYISSLRLENIDKMNLFKNVSLLHFSRLHSLTLCRLYITNDILDLLRYHAPHLQYLNISLFVSSKWNILLQLILSLPKLETCYLHLGIGLCPIKSPTVPISPLKHLVLVGSHQPCCTKRVALLFNSLPSLHSLHIQCNHLKFTEHYTSKLLFLSSFSLDVQELPILFIDFAYFISNTMPHIEKLVIKCYNPLRDLVYLNVCRWIKLIDLLCNLNELILIITPDKTMNKKAWNRRCDQLINFTNIRHIVFQIINSKEHEKQL